MCPFFSLLDHKTKQPRTMPESNRPLASSPNERRRRQRPAPSHRVRTRHDVPQHQQPTQASPLRSALRTPVRTTGRRCRRQLDVSPNSVMVFNLESPSPTTPSQATQTTPLLSSTIISSPPPPTTTTTTRSVRFRENRDGSVQEDICQDQSGPHHDNIDKKRIWWQHGDYSAFKSTAKLIASEIRRRQPSGSRFSASTSYSSIMMRTYALCCRSAREYDARARAAAAAGTGANRLLQPYQRRRRRLPHDDDDHDHVDTNYSTNDSPTVNVDEEGEDNIDDDDDDCWFEWTERDREQLRQWVDVGICRRGLEKWSIPSVAKDRQRRKDIHIQTVLDLQQRAHRIEGGFSRDEIDDFLRKKSRELSR